jgi:MscS family membrane protein
VVLDRQLLTSSSQLTNRPDGDLQDGLAIGRDRVGVVESASGNVDVFVDRVQRGRASPVWLFSSDTLREIPRLYDDVQPLWIEQHLPEWLRTNRWLSIPLYRWIAIPLVIPLFFGLAALASRVLIVALRRLLRRRAREQDDSRLASLGPLRLLVFAFFCYGASFFGLTLTVRNLWQGLAGALTVIALCWLAMRLMDVVTAVTLEHLQRVNRSEATALLRLVDRLAKAAAVVVAGLVLLYRSGIDLTAVLAGLGVGGLAIGFGAQRTIENLFGGIMVISDKPVNVGDSCRAGEFFGIVEDIGIRSTRIRTMDRTVVSIPNGQLATMSLENFAVRDRIRFHQAIGLAVQTTPDQVRVVLGGIRKLLEAHRRVDAKSARTRFIRFSGGSLDIEIVAYVLERDHTAFLAIQEELLLGIMDIIGMSGTSLALPPRALLVAENKAAAT